MHFTRDTTPWADLGWKLMAANVSDIAAMGGHPLYSLVTLGLPSDTQVEDMRSLYEGMLEAAGKYEVAIVGGDIVRSPVHVHHPVPERGPSRQAHAASLSAKPGYQIGVSGYPGFVSRGSADNAGQPMEVDAEARRLPAERPPQA